MLNREVEQDFMREVLEKGASGNPLDSFEKFRGRAPSIDAPLQNYGLIEDTPLPKKEPLFKLSQT